MNDAATSQCVQCSVGSAAGDAFCRVCGASLRRDRVAPGDRRQLTVMFCDLVESTALASRLDPEDVQTVLQAYQQLTSDVVANVDGRVAQYLGDGVLVYFGHPAAHEDDPLRAVSAALEIMREMPALAKRLRAAVPGLGPGGMAVRIGIHTGPVVVGDMGSKLRREPLASGSTVNLAARLAASAMPGTVNISAATAGRVGALVVLEPLGERYYKGVPEAVSTFRLLSMRGARSRLENWANGSRHPLVGRDALLGALLDSWSTVKRGALQIVVLRGEAGIGKTRLVQALHQRLAAETHAWLPCHGAALQQASALYPVVEAMRAFLDLDGTETAPVVRARIEAASAHLAPDMTDRIAGFLGHDVGRSPRTIGERAGTLAAIAQWLLGQSRAAPVVIALEDLHWFDPSSLELFQLLIETAADAPILIVGTMRPEAVISWPAVTVIDVPALSDDDIAAMVGGIIDGSNAPPGTIAAIVAHCDGVALYAEELAQAIAGHGVGGPAALGGDPVTGIPGSLQDSLMARLDRLGPNRRLAQLASLLGRSFTHEQLGAVSGLDDAALTQGLTGIAAQGILHRIGVPPRATYAFHHALLQDAAAASILRQQFRRDHLGIAAALSERFPGLAEENPSRIAHHYAQAGANAEALAWYRTAGARAQGRAEYREAEIAWRRAIDIAETGAAGTDGVADLHDALGQIMQLTHGYAAPGTLAALGRATLPLATDQRLVFLGQQRRLWQASLIKGEYGAARAHADDVVARLGADRFDHDLRTFALGAAIHMDFYAGDLAGVEAAYLDFLTVDAAVRRRQLPGNTVSAIGMSAIAAWARGEAGLARQRIGDALDFAETTGNSYDLAMALYFHTQLVVCQRDIAAAIDVAARLQAVATEHGYGYVACLARNAVCWADALGGKSRGNSAAMRKALQQQDDDGVRLAVSQQLNRLAEVEAHEGDNAGALATVERALAFNPAERVFRPEGLLLRARLQSSSAGVVGDLREAMTLAREMGALAVELPAANALARLFLDRGDPAAAQAVLLPVAGRGSSGCNPADHAEMTALLQMAAIATDADADVADANPVGR